MDNDRHELIITSENKIEVEKLGIVIPTITEYEFASDGFKDIELKLTQEQIKGLIKLM